MNHSALAVLFLVSACASGPKRVVVDSSGDRPAWASKPLVWSDGEQLYYRTAHTIRGDERTDGCMDLGKLDLSETILTELATNVKGSVDNAQLSLNENAESVLGKVRSGEFKGRLTGLKVTENYWERYRIQNTERIECQLLGVIDKADYERVKRSVVDQVVAADPRIKEAIAQKQINFFSESKTPTSEDSKK